MHITSNVSGRLADDKSAFDALQACLPAGTVSGAPKVRAMEIIDEIEPHRRGPYAGAVGYVDFNGNMDTCIALRTVVIHDNIAYVQAGAGIVADSVPENEWNETLNKAKGLLKAIEFAEQHAGRVKVLTVRNRIYGFIQHSSELTTAHCPLSTLFPPSFLRLANAKLKERRNGKLMAAIGGSHIEGGSKALAHAVVPCCVSILITRYSGGSAGLPGLPQRRRQNAGRTGKRISQEKRKTQRSL